MKLRLRSTFGPILAATALAWGVAPGSIRGQEVPPPPAAEAKKAADAPAPSVGAAPSGASPTAGAEPRPGIDRNAVRRLLLTANPMLWPLAACSILTMGFALERFLALRRKRVVPPEFVDRFLERLASGKLDRDRALELCKAHDSVAGRVFGHVVRAWGRPGAEIRQTVAFDSAGEIIELKRNLRVLSAMATLGPLLGLLGTVVGIIQSFDALGGKAGPARGEMLAQGISLALIATAFGLGIAILAVSMYYYLLNRLDVLTRELDDYARQVVDMVAGDSVRPSGVDRRIPPGLPNDLPRPQETRVV
ncbi:MotA/TolQ/ExbB proton channel family protein [Paludisphaera mucosa]|uniref:MotA/TolQ/ExbB proton channel family protein n=1 Tax=Paludisphaera mucosa TaxID=3030827 RepID=A0ABT6FCS3_9BACT|nr:MotA/TolQ/ExbB proton channel family protein [Paludisphaera mucosa]MDG3005188.1 MotA/TolQ/ExbB proton channel family protein [Paludisphaera mucosa]